MSRPPSWPFDVAKGAVALAFGWGWYTTPNPDAPPEIMMASRWSRVRELAWIIWTGDPAFEKTLLNDSFLFGLLGLCISLALVAVGQFFCFVLLPWLMAKPTPWAEYKRAAASLVDRVRGAHAAAAAVMAEAAPARAGAREGFAGFDALSDDLVLRVFARAPFATHGTVRAVCRRLNTLLRSPEFRRQRLDSGFWEFGLVVAGGRQYGAPVLVGECSIFTGNRWRSLPPMSGPRALACSAVVHNELFVIGGLNRHADEVATVEVYSPKTNSWSLRPPMSQRRKDAVAGVVGGRLLVAGGSSPDEQRLTSVEAYDGTKWTPVPPLPHAAESASACVLNGRLYVIGGRGSKKLQVLAITKKGLSWSCKAELPVNRSGAATVVHRGKIWVMGGYENGRSTASVITYDAKADAWESSPRLPVACRDCHAATGDGGIVLFGSTEAPGHGEGQLSVFVCRNAAWSAAGHLPVAGPGSHFQYAACGGVFLG